MDTVFIGLDDGPPTQLHFKRALLKPAPREFTIEIMGPVKHGSNYSYGVRVCPVSRPLSDTHSISSRASIHTDYEIWRRWEDCLDFQSTLESEYEQLSRHKVKVLKRGAKKHDGESIYSQKNGASSFDSLPEGPDPREVALNVHDLIPPLNKKGTLFRPSRATVELRASEFAAMMRGLFNPDPDAPVLLRELRNSKVVRDFFGYWRRDKDMAEKYGSKMAHSNRSMSSILSPVGQDCPPLPSPNSSTLSTPQTPLTPIFMTEAAQIKQYATATVYAQEPQPNPPQLHGDSYFPRASPPSSPGQSILRRPTAPIPPPLNPPKSVLQAGISHMGDMTGGSPRSLNSWQGHDSGQSFSSPIREERVHQFHRPLPPQAIHPPPTTRLPSTDSSDATHSSFRPRSNSTNVPDYRRAYPHQTELHSMPVRRPEGQTMQQHPASPSVASNLQGLHKFSSNPSLRDRHERTLRSPPSSSNFSQATSISSRFSNMSLNRSSVNSSISGFTYMSKSSLQADMYEEGDSDYDDISAAFPSPPVPPSHRTPLSNIDERHPIDSPTGNGRYHDYRASIASLRTEVSADGVLPPHLREAWGLDDEGSDGCVIDPYLSRRGDSYTREARKNISRDSNRRYSGSSLSSSGSFGSTGEPSDTVAIKAAYYDHIVMFRVDRTSTLRDVQQRVRDRLALHESVPMRASFVLAYIPNWTSNSNGQRVRSSLSMPSSSDSSRLRLLQNDFDWQTVLSTSNNKVSIRVLDPETVPRYI